MKLYRVLAHALLFQLCAVMMTVSAAAKVEEKERSPLITNGIENDGNRGYEERLSLKKKKRSLLVDAYVSSIRDWVPRRDDSVLPIGMTAVEEAEVLQQQTATESYGLMMTRSNNNSSKNPKKPRFLPEWNPMQGVLIAYSTSYYNSNFGLSLELIKAMSKRAKIFCLLEKSDKKVVKQAFENTGIPSKKVVMIYGTVDSYWTRDYGPWFVSTKSSKKKGIAVVNHKYNRPRPGDNDAPKKVAEKLDVPYYDSNIIGCGGNMMVDGNGQAAATHIAYTESLHCNTKDDTSVPLLGCKKLDKVMKKFYGVKTFHVVADPSNVYIDHVDCWAKYLSPTKILIREVPMLHPQYNDIEEVVAYFSDTQTAEGNNWEIVRVWTNSDQPYTNSLILNGEVFVPIVGSEFDTAALETYRSAMPDYKVSGWEGDWESTDALHCRTLGIPEFQ